MLAPFLPILAIAAAPRTRRPITPILTFGTATLTAFGEWLWSAVAFLAAFFGTVTPLPVRTLFRRGCGLRTIGAR